jgi:hypothetical protein
MVMTGNSVRDTWQALREDGRNFDEILSEGRIVRSRRESRDPRYLAKLAEAAGFLADVLDGRRRTWQLEEALTTSDFPILMGDILDRQLLGRYQEIPTAWQAYAKRGSVRDFRTVRRIQTDGLEGRFYPTASKPEMTTPLENDNLSETGYTYAVAVYERATALNWRMLVNDDLDAFRDIPDRMARGARRTEDYFATQLHVDANGPHASLYTSGNKNQVITANGAVTSNPALSIAGLQDAFTVIGNMVDADGEPIMIDAVVLEVPPALEVVAQNILNATELWVGGDGQTGGGGTAAQRLIVANWMRRKMALVVNPYIPIVASSANGSTTWFVHASPSVSRPAMEVGFLRGYETPAILQKTPNTQMMGGAPDMTLGDFDTGEIRYKGRHIIGGTRLDPKATFASNGSGS